MTKNRKHTPDILSVLMDGTQQKGHKENVIASMPKHEFINWQESDTDTITLLQVNALDLSNEKDLFTMPLEEPDDLECIWLKLCRNAKKERD